MSSRVAISNSSFNANKKPTINSSLDRSTGVVVFVHLDDSKANTIAFTR